MNWQRFAVLNVAAAAVMILLAIGGYLTEAYAGPGKYGVIGASGLLVLALALMAFDQWHRAKWITKHMTAFGLVGTVIGVIEAFTHANYGGDAKSALASVGLGIGLALFSTLSGILGYLWLDLVTRECRVISYDDPDYLRE